MLAMKNGMRRSEEATLRWLMKSGQARNEERLTALMNFTKTPPGGAL